MYIIPEPVSVKEFSGNFIFTEKSKIILFEINEETKSIANFLVKLINNASGFSPPVIQGNHGEADSVFMEIDPSINIKDEGYVLLVTPEKIIIKAKTSTGFFYAVQTIRQLLHPSVEKNSVIFNIELRIPSCEIIDEPRFKYRGMHLDVSRHMFPLDYIKKYIDMASY